MLSALFSISEDFISSIVQKIQSLRNKFPIFCIFAFSFKPFLIDKLCQKITLFFTPIIRGQVDFFQAEPFEHARLCCNSRNKRGNGFPILIILDNNIITNYFSISTKCCLSAYLEMTHMSICTSSSLQFFFIRLFLIILNNRKETYRFEDWLSWVWFHRSWNFRICVLFEFFANSEPRYRRESMCASNLQGCSRILWSATLQQKATGSARVGFLSILEVLGTNRKTILRCHPKDICSSVYYPRTFALLIIKYITIPQDFPSKVLTPPKRSQKECFGIKDKSLLMIVETFDGEIKLI